MDWQKMVGELLASGLTEAKLAAMVGTTQGHINSLKTGRRGEKINYVLGAAIVREHKKLQRRMKNDGIPGTVGSGGNGISADSGAGDCVTS